MEIFIPVLAIVVVVVAWNVFLYKISAGRMWSPLWMAFSATVTAGLFLGAGFLGYTLSKHDRFVAGTAWSDGVIWWEVSAGLAASVVALFLWRKGLRSIRTLSLHERSLSTHNRPA